MKIEACGCCEGGEHQTPLNRANRPGLSALSYRAGTHATFLETMKGRLAGTCIGDDDACDAGDGLYPLQQLTTRDSSDPAIALLDAWATVGDVLTFYQERLANEGFLRTASERRSILELARLVGYKLRPGVASSVYLAFLLEDSYEGEAQISAGTRAQSLPGPGELPQSFETAEPLIARTAWNQIMPRLSKPQELNAASITDLSLYFEGVGLNLSANEPILIDFGEEQKIYRIDAVDVDASASRTEIILRDWKSAAAMTVSEGSEASPQPAPIGTSINTLLHAGHLHEFAAALAEIALDEPDGNLFTLLEEFADALLASFVVIAETPPSTKRDQAIAQDVAALEQIEALLRNAIENLPATAVLMSYRQRMHTWAEQSLVILQAETPAAQGATTDLGSLVTTLSQPTPLAALPPASAFHLKHDAAISYGPNSDFRIAAIIGLLPHALSKEDMYLALDGAKVTPDATVRVYVLRTKAAPFGHTAPPRQDSFEDGIYIYGEWEITNPLGSPEDNTGAPTTTAPGAVPAAASGVTLAGDMPHHEPGSLYLNAQFDLPPESWVIIELPENASVTTKEIIVKAGQVTNGSLTAYGLSGNTSKLTLETDDEWIMEANELFSTVRNTRVFLESEELFLAQAPVEEDVPAESTKTQIIVDGLYDGLEPGRWLFVSGERSDVEGVSGLRASERVMLQAVEQIFNANMAGDSYHTRLIFDNDLAYSYKRETVVIYANVVRTTHGETGQEVLGSGDGSKQWQQFKLKQSPLTYLSAPTPAGAESTLEVRVNDILWPEAADMVALEGGQRGYMLQTDNESKTTIRFGDGAYGARLPTGSENISARYRSGIGKPGNVAAEQISLLATRPLGVKSVINPQAAAGGADREPRDQARRNAPLAIMALDRLVSVQDYADFARTFAGIGKASATILTDGRQEIVHLTIAGADDIPITESSDLFINLGQALRLAGDSHQPFEVKVRELMVLVVIANIRIHPDYLWDKVAADIRTALLDTFSFEKRDLGQDVFSSEIIATIQQIQGVSYVDVDLLESISETEAKVEESLEAKMETLAGGGDPDQPKPRIPVHLARPDPDNKGNRLSAQIAFLNPDIPDTIILKEIT